MKKLCHFILFIAISAVIHPCLSRDKGPQKFIGFESAPVRPIAKIDELILVTNIPSRQLAIFKKKGRGKLSPVATVPVGLEPVSVAVYNNKKVRQAWVVNHLSDSISIIDLNQPHFPVIRTLLVGDEPRDIVFAHNKAFITTAHRGQHKTHPSIADVSGAGDPQLFTASTPRADVWVFDADNIGQALGGKPLKIIELFGDTPRALTVSSDQKTVYVAVFNSGNQTTAITESALCNGFDDYGFNEAYIGTEPCQMMDKITSPNGLKDAMLPGGRPGPGKNAFGTYQPWVGMIVKYHRPSGQWRDVKGRNFSNAVRFTLPDKDVFAIDVATLEEKKHYSHVGTTLFNMITNPVTGSIYVSNTDAQNHIRFEGPGKHGGSTVQGNLARSQITVINPTADSVSPRHLNRHINYDVLKSPESTKKHSLAQPTQMAITHDGKLLYVVSTGSNKIGVYHTKDLEDHKLWQPNTQGFDPTQQSAYHIDTPHGPMGILLDDTQQQLYVLGRYNNSLMVIDTTKKIISQTLTMTNPEPDTFQAGRFMLYDAIKGSSNGEASCASCHISGDMDHLSWDLGNPDAPNTRNPQPFPTLRFSDLSCMYSTIMDQNCQIAKLINGNGDMQTFASMKGPMTTQTMRGMSTHGNLHWRGDRSNGYFGIDNSNNLNERQSFKNFIVAFEGLQGLDIELPSSSSAKNKTQDVVELESNMDKFADFMLSVQLPPNPIRNLDNSLSHQAKIGQQFFHGSRKAVGLPEPHLRPSYFPKLAKEFTGKTCAGCHVHNPEKGFYGSDGKASHGGEMQVFKTPSFRNLYQKVGMFGMPYHFGYRPTLTNQHQGEQVRGFGFLHDGATDLLFNFLGGRVFDNGDISCEQENLPEEHGCDYNLKHVGIPDDSVRQGLVSYLMEFDSDIAPIVGQQITVTTQHKTQQVIQRIELLKQRAETPFVSKILGGRTRECDLIVNGVINNQRISLIYLVGKNHYRNQKQTIIDHKSLMAHVNKQGNYLTFSCVLPKTGKTMAFL